jgi:hypothetical protein
MSPDLQTVTMKATVSAIHKKTVTRQRTITKRWKTDISSQAVLKHTWMEETKLADHENISSIACILGVAECTSNASFQNQRQCKETTFKKTDYSKINKFHFAMLCLVLQYENPRVTSECIIRIVARFLKECGDTYQTYLNTAVNDYISKNVAKVQQKDPCLSIGDCEGLVIYSFLWNVARLLRTT